MDHEERIYRCAGILVLALPTVLLAVGLAVLLGIPNGPPAIAFGVGIGMIGTGAGMAVGSEVYRRKQRGQL